VLALLWSLIRHHLTSSIKTKGRPELKALRRAGESFESWLSVQPEDLLLRWINHHLQQHQQQPRDGVLVAFEDLAEVSSEDAFLIRFATIRSGVLSFAVLFVAHAN
jgi:hypothetical protein